MFMYLDMLCGILMIATCVVFMGIMAVTVIKDEVYNWKKTHSSENKES